MLHHEISRYSLFEGYPCALYSSAIFTKKACLQMVVSK
jgi:hypothetical protein